MHNYFMLAALEQAWLGRGFCAPNPSVGAVAVHQGEIIARAWHQGVGTAHAEHLLLEQIPLGLDNLTFYVTLEPCNHIGRTPPCTTAIIKRGVSKVVYGFSDPNPVVVANNTPNLLRKNNIEVLHYPTEEINAFYKSYYHWILTKKPWVTAKIAQSLDAKIAPASREKVQLSNSSCAEFTHKNRLHTDLILTTARTIQADDPLMTARLNNSIQNKPLAILDSRLSLTEKSQIFRTAKHCHIYYDEQYKINNQLPNSVYHAIPAKEGLLDLNKIIHHLGSLGYHDVWVEAGGTLFSALHREQLVQQTYLYITPHILGEKSLSSFQGEVVGSPSTVSWEIRDNNAIVCLNWHEG